MLRQEDYQMSYNAVRGTKKLRVDDVSKLHGRSLRVSTPAVDRAFEPKFEKPSVCFVNQNTKVGALAPS